MGLTLLGALLLASVHVFSERLAFLNHIPRSRWLSFAGGVSVAYVFVHLLPELSAHQESFEASGVLPFLEHHLYAAALLGLSTFYGLERLVRRDEERGRTKGDHTPLVFWLHVASFALYNGLIGYLLVHREEAGKLSLFLYLLALAPHFLVNDHGLRHEHVQSYHRLARWVLAGAVLIGWLSGKLVRMDSSSLALLFAVLAGGIVLNVLKEELPEERQSRFWAFAGGAGGYALILLFA